MFEDDVDGTDNAAIFEIVNTLTGITVSVFDRGLCFVAEQHTADGAYIGQQSFDTDTEAITHAIMA